MLPQHAESKHKKVENEMQKDGLIPLIRSA